MKVLFIEFVDGSEHLIPMDIIARVEVNDTFLNIKYRDGSKFSYRKDTIKNWGDE